MKKTEWINISEKFKYLRYQELKLRAVNLFAPILNHPKRDDITSILINLTFTWVVICLVAWSLEIRSPLRKGFGIAVTIAVAQYYFSWVVNQIRK